jgi:hypothetical protein
MPTELRNYGKFCVDFVVGCVLPPEKRLFLVRFVGFLGKSGCVSMVGWEKGRYRAEKRGELIVLTVKLCKQVMSIGKKGT